MIGKKAADAVVEDLLDGTYLIDLTAGAGKKKKEPVQVLFGNKAVWKGQV